jgi:MFS family permease
MQLIPEPYRDLPREAYVLFFARMVNSLGSFVRPLLALLLTDKLGLSKAEAGLFVTLAVTAYVPGSLLGGKLADHVGRKRVFVASWVLAVLCLVPCAFLGASPAVAWLLVLNSFFLAVSDPALTAMVADFTHRGNRQPVYALLYLGNNLGFAVGPMLAGLLYRRHLPWVFLGDGATTLLSLALMAALLGESLPSRQPAEGEERELDPHERAEEGSTVRALWRRPAILAFALTQALYTFVYAQHAFSLPLQLRELFGVEGPRLFGLLMSVNALVVVFFTTLVTRITRGFSPLSRVALGGLLYAAGFGMIGQLSRMPWFAASTAIWTIGEILVATNARVYVADHTPSSHRGRFTAVTEIISGTGFAVAPTIMGRLSDRQGLPVVWQTTGALAAGAALAVLLLGLSQRGSRPPAESETAS